MDVPKLLSILQGGLRPFLIREQTRKSSFVNKGFALVGCNKKHLKAHIDPKSRLLVSFFLFFFINLCHLTLS